jgi:HK97 family phage major capsid protein
MSEEIKSQLDELNSAIDSRIAKAEGQAVASATGKADELLKGEIKNLETKFNEIHSRIDAQEIANKKFGNGATVKSFKQSLVEGISKGALDAIINGTSRSAKFEIKAGDMTVANNFTGEVIPAQYVPGIKYDPTRPVHVRQLLPQGSTTAEVVRYVRESAYDNGAAATAQGATFTESDFDLTAYDANVQKIGTYFRISEEMLNDTPQLTSYLAARAPEKLLTVEDTQLLYGNGTTPNISGISTSGATAFAAGSFADTITAANQFDVLTVAINQLALVNYRPDYIMLNPTDFAKILLLKATTNEYLQEQAYMGLQPQFLGIPVVQNTAITAGTYLVGNFGLATQMWVRENLSLEFFREDGTNVRDGFVTVRLVERIALTNYAPLAIVKGVFATDIAAIGV